MEKILEIAVENLKEKVKNNKKDISFWSGTTNQGKNFRIEIQANELWIINEYEDEAEELNIYDLTINQAIELDNLLSTKKQKGERK